MARARDWFQIYINSQILLQTKRICYVFLNTDKGKGCFCGRLTLLLMSFSEVYQIIFIFRTSLLTLLLSIDFCATATHSLYSSYFYCPIQIFPYIFQTLISKYHVSQKISPDFSCPFLYFTHFSLFHSF